MQTEAGVIPAVHFVGFKGDEYLSAVMVWGKPDFIHRGWDRRAHREIHESDTVIFATGEHDQEPRQQSYNDVEPRSEWG